jgi:RNAse (barnase) inhibitor barstar
MKQIPQILSDPALNGVYRLARNSDLAPVLDGGTLNSKESLLVAIGRALDFPDYFGVNWDALEECLTDMSWHVGPIALRIEHADRIPSGLLDTLVALFMEAAAFWREEGRVCCLFLGGMRESQLPGAA